MDPRFSFRQLRYFSKVAETGSLGAASAVLGISSSALSDALDELEAQFGAPVLIRQKGRGAVLTPLGRDLLPQARSLLAAASAIQDSAGGASQPLSGNLVVGCMNTFAPFVMPRLIVEFGVAHPGVTIEIVEGSQIEIQKALNEGKCEVAILYDDGDLNPRLMRRSLYKLVPHVVLWPEHRMARRRTVRLQDLADDPFIMVDIPPSRENIKSIFRLAGCTPNTRHVTASLEMCRALVARGLGYSMLVQRPAVDVSYEGLPLVMKPITGVDSRMDVVFCNWASDQPVRRVAALFEVCERLLS